MVMNFWNDRELALRFRNNEVPSKEQFLYLILSIIINYLLITESTYYINIIYNTC